MGIGLDAKYALGFHKLREKYPKLFKTQVIYSIICYKIVIITWR